MRRAWMLVAAGAVLLGTATVLGLILFRKNGVFEPTVPELQVWSVVVGTMTVASLALVYGQMRAPPVERRTRLALFGLFGAVCVLIAGVVLTQWNEVCLEGGIDYDYCGSVLGLGTTSFWQSLGLLAALGVVLGTVGGVTAAWLTRGRQAQTAIRTWNLVIGAIVLVVAAAATTFVISRPPPPPPIRMVATIIPLEDIPANQLLDPLIEEGLFEEILLPSDVAEGAVTDVRDLYGMRTTTVILANELILRSRLTTSSP